MPPGPSLLLKTAIMLVTILFLLAMGVFITQAVQ